MTEPSTPRPVPGPPRPSAGPAPQVTPASPPSAAVGPEASAEDRFAGLEGIPVSEHVAVFEDEHARLRRELATIDQL
jgi:hypothetical protein